MALRPLTLANGLQTRVWDSEGSGPPVLLLHGLALSIEIWDKVLSGLAVRHRVLAFDFPGFGQADRPDAPYDGAFFVDQTVAALDALKLPRANLIGSSLGASTVLRLSVNHADRIDRAVLMAPGGLGRASHPTLRLPTLPLVGYALGKPSWFSNAYALRLAMANPDTASRALIDLMAGYGRRPGAHRAFVRTVQTGLGPFGARRRDRENLCAAARRFPRPALVLWGERDRIFPVAQAEIARSLLPDCRLVRIPECGHYPHWEQPDVFLRETLAFLDAP